MADTFTDDAPAIANQISADLESIETSLGFLKDCFQAICSDWSDTDATGLQVKALQAQNIWLPAHQWKPTSTAGCAALANTELTTNDIQLEYLAFDHTTQEHATISRVMPEGWDLGTIKAKFYWVPTTGCSASDVVVWGIQGVAVSNDDAIDATMGDAVTKSDTVLAGTTGDLHVSDATDAITIGGTPALGDLIHLKIYRDADSEVDTMTEEDAWLIGVMLQVTIDQEVTAW